MFEAYNSRWRLGMMALGCAGFVVAGLWLVGAFGPDHPYGLKASVAGWASIPLFGFCAILALRRMGQRGPVIRIDDVGILYTHWSRERIIPWDAIDRMGVVQIRRQKMLGIALSQREMTQPKTLSGRLGAANAALTGFPICLTTAGTDRSFDDLLAAVDRYHPAGRS
jgi:hypothetical protein